MKSILVTGATGFVGQHFLRINSNNYLLKKVSLQDNPIINIDFSGVETVLHLAGIAHRMERTEDALYFNVNYALTKELAIAAKVNGVKHFIFISTIKVYGDEKDHLTLEAECRPNDAYGKSKLKAEEAILELITDSFNVTIVRPPLIYGYGVKGNVEKLMRLVDKRRIIPLGDINNKRSMVGVDNLVSLLNLIIEERPDGIFLVQDDTPVSTSELISQIGKAKGLRLRLVSIPVVFRFLIKKVMPEIYKRLFGNLTVDDSKTRKELNFRPPYSFAEGIELMTKNN